MTKQKKAKMPCTSRLLISVGILSVNALGSLGMALEQSGPVAVPLRPVETPSNAAMTPSNPNKQPSGAVPDSRALAEAILRQGVMLNAASSVTDSSLTQHERRVQQHEGKAPPPRKKRGTMALEVPAIVAIGRAHV